MLTGWTIGVLAAEIMLLGIASTGMAHGAVQVGVSEASVTVKPKLCIRGGLEPAKVYIKDSSNKILRQTAAGSQVLLQAVVKNNCQIDNLPVTIILEVRDKEGITRYMTLQKVTVSANQHIVMASSSWVPENPGDHEIRAFTISNTVRMGVLVPVIYYKITVY